MSISGNDAGSVGRIDRSVGNGDVIVPENVRLRWLCIYRAYLLIKELTVDPFFYICSVSILLNERNKMLISQEDTL